MLEMLKSALFYFVCYGMAFVVIGCVLGLLRWIFNYGSFWVQSITILIILGWLTYGIIDGIINSEPSPIYYDDIDFGPSNRYS